VEEGIVKEVKPKLGRNRFVLAIVSLAGGFLLIETMIVGLLWRAHEVKDIATLIDSQLFMAIVSGIFGTVLGAALMKAFGGDKEN